jgi:hypothetical protein
MPGGNARYRFQNCQGFRIGTHGETHRRDTEISGLWLVAEQ